MKKRFILPLLTAFCLSSCHEIGAESNFFYYGTSVNIKLFDGSKKDIKEIDNEFLANLDKLCDAYESRGVNNIYTINHTNEPVEVDALLYSLLVASSALSVEYPYFNPLCGSLASKWKEALNNNTVLSNDVISQEVSKIHNSQLKFVGSLKVQRVGEATIDLGAVTKGFALDLAKTIFDVKELKEYIVNAGNSSILLGEKNNEDHLFVVGLKELEGYHVLANNTYISTSSVSLQGKTIDGVKYSHIVNPFTGSAVNLHDAVIVFSNNGMLGDVLSTAMMNSTIDEIKEIEQEENVKCIVIKDNNVEYKNEGLTLISDKENLTK